MFYLIRENNENVELHLEDKKEYKQAGGIYKGKIKRMSPAMNAVFLDIGEEKEAFLPVKDLSNGNYNIGKPILVQVKRTPVGTKGSKLSENIAIPGKYLVLTPKVSKISISSKYTSPSEKKQLKERIKEILQPYNEENFGFIIRTLACEASDNQIIEDFLNLKQLWKKITEAFNKKKAPSVLYDEEYKLYSILKDYAGNFDKIVVDDINIFKIVKNHIKTMYPDRNIKLQFFKEKTQTIEEKYQFQKTISRILNPYVWLKSGGYLIVEETEALVVIDVNSGKHCKQKSIEDTAFFINIEATKEIIKTLRLKDLGGIIVIDFIDMSNEERKNILIEKLKEEAKNDRRSIKIKDFTSLGLLQLTRKKTEESLIKKLTQGCYCCRSNGFVKSFSLIMFEIEKEIQKRKPFATMSIKINPLLEEHLKSLLKSLKLTKNVKILKDEKLHVENFIIESV
ncbi:MAG TPA: Rne/Rng family ribonuclease [Hydrogenothermaceae bacterium]|nr:Rne/Rng family ribonuclease [Hydrogenothermaceae bacterium]